MRQPSVSLPQHGGRYFFAQKCSACGALKKCLSPRGFSAASASPSPRSRSHFRMSLLQIVFGALTRGQASIHSPWRGERTWGRHIVTPLAHNRSTVGGEELKPTLVKQLFLVRRSVVYVQKTLKSGQMKHIPHREKTGRSTKATCPRPSERGRPDSEGYLLPVSSSFPRYTRLSSSLSGSYREMVGLLVPGRAVCHREKSRKFSQVQRHLPGALGARGQGIEALASLEKIAACVLHGGAGSGAPGIPIAPRQNNRIFFSVRIPKHTYPLLT